MPDGGELLLVHGSPTDPFESFSHDMSDEELVTPLAESRENLFNLRFQMATGALDNSARLSLANRYIARLLTVPAERRCRDR